MIGTCVVGVSRKDQHMETMNPNLAAAIQRAEDEQEQEQDADGPVGGFNSGLL